MPVVSDTSPLMNLAIIGQLGLLHRQMGTVVIPLAVREELQLDSQLPGSDALRQAAEAGWLEVRSVQDATLAKALERQLDRGEAEAIALAVEIQAEWLLLDEREARRAAKALGLKVTGVIGVLLRAKQRGELLSVRLALEELQQRAGFRIGKELLDGVLRQASE